jgi:hypothetical protein
MGDTMHSGPAPDDRRPLGKEQAGASTGQSELGLSHFRQAAYLETDGGGHIHEANRVAARLFNVPQHRLVGKPFPVFLTRDQRADFRLQLGLLPRLQHLDDWELVLRPRDRAPIQVSATVAIQRATDGRTTALHWLLRDISAHKRVEAEQLWLLRRAEHAEEALERRVAELTVQIERATAENATLLTKRQHTLTVACHDLGTELASLVSSLQCAEQKLAEDPLVSPWVSDMLSDLQVHAGRLNVLTTDLIALTHADGVSSLIEAA